MSKTLFTKVDYALGSLIDAIGDGQIGLPDIERPFRLEKRQGSRAF